MKAAIYARVSTEDQHCELQLTELRAYCLRNNWEVFEYIEKASGKAGARRPVLQKLMEDARLKRFDAVLVWKVDRFGRSIGNFVENVRTLDSLGIRFIAPTQSIDTDQRSPIAKLLMNLLALLAEFERDLIVERVSAGVTEYRRAFKAGKVGIERKSKSGKNLPHGRPSKIFPRDKAKAMRAEGKSWNEIAKALRVNKSTVRKALREE